MSPERYWTIDEARAALPRLRQLLGLLQRMSDLATRVRSNGHADIRGDERRAHPSTGSVGANEPVSADIQPVLEELEEMGIVLRDPARGLIDFPAMHLGRPVQLCWQLGEENLDWWHFPEAGFAGRQPLPLPTEW